MQNSIIVSEEVDLINSKGVSSDLLNNGLDDLIIANLNSANVTAALLTTLTFLR
jgi:hypothetical protein